MNSKGGPLGKKCFIEAPETPPDILLGGYKNPYQLEDAIKSGGTVFCLYHLGYIVYQGAVCTGITNLMKSK